jgi:hypothetical protein
MAIKKKCKLKDILISKHPDSAEIKLGHYEPSIGVGQITETFWVYLVKEGVNVERVCYLAGLSRSKHLHEAPTVVR